MNAQHLKTVAVLFNLKPDMRRTGQSTSGKELCYCEVATSLEVAMSDQSSNTSDGATKIIVMPR